MDVACTVEKKREANDMAANAPAKPVERAMQMRAQDALDVSVLRR